MRVIQQLVRFVRNLFTRTPSPPVRIEDSPEVELETELKRGMRGL